MHNFWLLGKAWLSDIVPPPFVVSLNTLCSHYKGYYVTTKKITIRALWAILHGLFSYVTVPMLIWQTNKDEILLILVEMF